MTSTLEINNSATTNALDTTGVTESNLDSSQSSTTCVTDYSLTLHTLTGDALFVPDVRLFKSCPMRLRADLAVRLSALLNKEPELTWWEIGIFS